MKDIFTNIYLSLKKNRAILLLSIVVVLTVKQILLYSILFGQGNISKEMLISHVLIQSFVLVIVLLLAQLYRSGIKKIKEENIQLKKDSEEDKLLIEKLNKQVRFYSKKESSSGESIGDIVQRVSSRLYSGLKQGEELNIESLFRRLCLSFEVGVGILYECVDNKVVQVADFDLPLESQMSYLLGEGIIGEVAETASPITLCNLPGRYFESFSGLGKTTPKNLQVFKVSNYVFEIAGHKEFSDQEIKALEKLIIESFSKK